MPKDIFEKIAESPAVILEETINATKKVGGMLHAGAPMRKTKEYWNLLGPGLTTGAADDDPSGIATYSQAGAQYGNQLLWLAGFTFPLMAIVQEMCARIGLVTGRGLASNIRRFFPRWMLLSCTILLFAANAFNIGADLGAMAKASQLLWPNVSFTKLIIGFTLVSLLLQIFSTYKRYAKYLKFLALILLSYIFSTLLIKGLDWREISQSAITPSLSFTKDQIILVCAILGTTISPYLFFWQTSQEVEEEILEGETTVASRQGTNKEAVKRMRIDVWSGMFLSNVVMFFIILACAATLFPNGITQIRTASEAAEALRPLAGEGTFLLFALGIIGTGLLAVPILAGSASYAVAESFGWKHGLFYQLKQAYAFYGVLIIAMLVGLGLNFVGIDPIKALIYSAVANGLVAPIILIFIVLISSNKKVMGEWTNRPLTRIIGWLCVILMVLAGLAAIYSFVA
ncbi:MAG TPA: Nramp family divalent metal transporter [Patescibacteria group bacterium]|nr:Nramp family divalent metal transporter [Patescibacteria group bacterium]